MKFVTALFLTVSTIFLTACSEPEVINRTVYECAWAERIDASDETKEWLGGLEWPPSAYAFFNDVGDHNELVERYCK